MRRARRVDNKAGGNESRMETCISEPRLGNIMNDERRSCAAFQSGHALSRRV
jgi:hypothetical protein